MLSHISVVSRDVASSIWSGELPLPVPRKGAIFIALSTDGPLLVMGTPGKNAQHGYSSMVYGWDGSNPSDLKRLVTFLMEEKSPPDIVVEVSEWKKQEVVALRNLGFSLSNNSALLEWVNPTMSHYVYKITSPESPKYYYGVRSIHVPNATESDCLVDNYMGSGGSSVGNKFANWKRRYGKSMVKEIVRIFDRKSEAYELEKGLVGDRWKVDPLCLNSCPGGKITGHHFSTERFQAKDCPVHGNTMHNGSTCMKCQSESSVSTRDCVVHGESKHIGDKCYKCIAESNIQDGFCKYHGEVKVVGKSCSKCTYESYANKAECPKHGLTHHNGKTCAKCSHPGYKKGICEVHGESTFIGSSCTRCAQLRVKDRKPIEAYPTGDCSVHGTVKFRAGKCYTCSASANVTIKECPVHGKSKHLGNKCYKCRKPADKRPCPVHGIAVVLKSGECSRCHRERIGSTPKTKECSLCGKTYVSTKRGTICDEKHLRDCIVCGKPFDYKGRKEYCSTKCKPS